MKEVILEFLDVDNIDGNITSELPTVIIIT
jgi:hypothetical protein